MATAFDDYDSDVNMLNDFQCGILLPSKITSLELQMTKCGHSMHLLGGANVVRVYFILYT